MENARKCWEAWPAEERTKEEACNPEVLGDPVECIKAWDCRMSEELRRIRPILEPLLRTQYPNPFMKWAEAFRIEAENFDKKKAGMGAA